MKRQPAASRRPTRKASIKALERFQIAEAETLRRFHESSRLFAHTLEGIGAEAELLRQDVLELASLIAPDPACVDAANAAIDRACAKCAGDARNKGR